MTGLLLVTENRFDKGYINMFEILTQLASRAELNYEYSHLNKYPIYCPKIIITQREE